MGLAACTRVSFLIANLPALGAARVADVPYGPDARERFDLYPATSVPAPAASPGARPLVVFFYGGGFTEGRRQDYRFVGSVLAHTGRVTVLPDYHVYPPARFPDFVRDGARAVVVAQREAARHGADPTRVVLAGHSAGAWVAAMLALEPRYLREAGGDPATIVGLIGLSGPYDLAPNSAALEDIFDSRATPDEYRPLRRATAAAPPTLLLHGADDDVVAAFHSERLAARLRALGVPVTLKIYPRRGHADTLAALSLPARARADSLAQISAFLASVDVAPVRAALPVGAGSRSGP